MAHYLQENTAVMRANQLKRIVLLIAPFVAFLNSSVSAQSARPAMPDRINESIEGPTSILDDAHRLAATDETLVQKRQSDSVLNGALIGAGVAVASGLFLCTRTEPWENCRDDVGPMLRIGAIGAGIGIAIDALIRGRRSSNEPGQKGTKAYVAPVVGRDAKGLRMSIRF